MQKDKPRILIVDSHPATADILKDTHLFNIETASSAHECLSKIETFQPELIILDFFFPGHHGIELLKLMKQSIHSKNVGVIMTSDHSMIQNYHASIKWGANYFLPKPYTIDTLLSVIHRFFNKTLLVDPFQEPSQLACGCQENYSPESKEPANYMKFWGTRGSNPVSGAEYIQFGGNTCCFEIKNGNDRVIIDAGTGIRVLGDTMSDGLKEPYHILFSHTHWDHLLGFPFFKPIYFADAKVHLIAPMGFDKSTKELFNDMLAYDYFPVSLDDIKSQIVFQDIRDSQQLNFGSIDIYTHYAFHPGATLCFRIHVAGKKIGYITDNEFLMGYFDDPNHIEKQPLLLKPYESMIEFFTGCDLMIHEAQYTPKEYKNKEGWGHSSISNASIFMKAAGIYDWIVTHHDPHHTDSMLQKKAELHQTIMEEIHHPCTVRLAYDGMTIPLT